MRSIARPVLLLCALLSVGLTARADDGPDAKTELAAAIAILKAHHMNSTKMDWPAIETQATTMLGDKTSAADAYPAIYNVIQKLGEKHTYLTPANVVKAQATDKAVGNARPPDVIPPEGHELAGGIGLIILKAHLGSAADDAVYAAAARNAFHNFAHRNICRYIVDLRADGGGNMYPMINGLETLLGVEPYGYWQGDNGAESPWRGTSGLFRTAGEMPPDSSQRDLQGKALVAVLIDRDTASSGEFTAMAFEGRPGTRFFGEPSAGYLTVNSPFNLPDGARLAVSEGWATDRLHRPYRAVITPDEATPRGQATLDAAINWLKAQPCAG